MSKTAIFLLGSLFGAALTLVIAIPVARNVPFVADVLTPMSEEKDPGGDDEGNSCSDDNPCAPQPCDCVDGKQICYQVFCREHVCMSDAYYPNEPCDDDDEGGGGGDGGDGGGGEEGGGDDGGDEKCERCSEISCTQDCLPCVDGSLACMICEEKEDCGACVRQSCSDPGGCKSDADCGSQTEACGPCENGTMLCTTTNVCVSGKWCMDQTSSRECGWDAGALRSPVEPVVPVPE